MWKFTPRLALFSCSTSLNNFVFKGARAWINPIRRSWRVISSRPMRERKLNDWKNARTVFYKHWRLVGRLRQEYFVHERFDSAWNSSSSFTHPHLTFHFIEQFFFALLSYLLWKLRNHRSSEKSRGLPITNDWFNATVQNFNDTKQLHCAEFNFVISVN